MKQCFLTTTQKRSSGANPLYCLDSKTKKPLEQTPVRTHHLVDDGTPEGSESDLTAFIALVLTPSEVNFNTDFRPMPRFFH
jgi:hypothetical protein